MAWKQKKPAHTKGKRSVPCSAIDCENGKVVDEDGNVTNKNCSVCGGTGYETVST